MNEDAIKKLKKRFDTVWQNRVNDMDDHCAEIGVNRLVIGSLLLKVKKTRLIVFMMQRAARLLASMRHKIDQAC